MTTDPTTGPATAAFTVDLRPQDALSDTTGLDTTGRFALTKTWTGDLEATSTGTMLTAGDPATGHAGYLALEVVTGTLRGRTGSFALLQLGTMDGGEPELTYVVAPGSGTGDLTGLTGTVVIGGIDEDGVHHVTLDLGDGGPPAR